MVKRLIAIVLCIAYMLGIIVTFNGCSAETASITKGEVLALIIDKFGMSDYTSENPYSDNSKSENPYYQMVQIACSWNIINDSQIDVYKPATKGFISEVLVKCVGLVDTTKMSSDEILEYAVDNNYVSFVYRGRSDSIRNITQEEANKSIEQSFLIWTNRYFETKEDLKVGEDVHNLVASAISANDFSIEENNNMAIISTKFVEDLKEGDTFILPASNDYFTPKAYRAEKIEIIGDNAYIHTSDVGIETTIQDLKASGSFSPNLSSGYIIDGVGNVISAGGEVTQQSINRIDDNSFINLNAPLNSSTQPAVAIPLASKTSLALNFNIDGLKITGTVSGDSVSFEVKGDIWTDKSKGLKLAVEKKYEIKDISLDYDYNIEWFKLKYAYAKINYTTVDKSDIKFSWNKTGVFAPSYSNGNGHFLSNATRAILKDSQAKGAKTIKICSIPIVSAGKAVSFNLDVKIKISLSGSLELIMTTNNVMGIEYKNGKIRYIQDQHQDTDLTVKGKAELTLYAGVSFKALTKTIIGFGVEGGIGCEVSATAHLADTSNHLIDEVSFGEVNSSIFEDALQALNGMVYEHDQYGTMELKCDICIDVVTYGILKFTIDSDCVLGGIFNEAEIVLYGKENAKIEFLCAHWEEGQKVEKCTRKYIAFEDNSSEIDDENTSSKNEGMLQGGDRLDIDVYFINIDIGESYKISVENIPDGYSIKDIEFISADEKVATVNSEGVIEGKSGGYVEIKAQTKDNKYNVSCSVYVVSSGVEFSPLNIICTDDYRIYSM